MNAESANFAAAIRHHAVAEPGRVALRSGKEVWTYERLWQGCERVAGAVREAGVKPGGRVLLIAPTVPEFAAAYYGLLAAGAVVVPMNPMATAPEIAYVVEDAECGLAIVWQECEVAAGEVAAEHGIGIWSLGPDLAGLPTAPPLPSPKSVLPSATAAILYTSGTTGRPKGAELTQDNIRECARAYTEVFEVRGEDCFGTALPLFHVFGGSVVMGTALLNGASLALAPRFDPAEMLALLSVSRITVFFGVPTMYNALLQEGSGEADFPALRLCVSGAASLPEEVIRAFDERFGAAILEGYGLTETTGAASFNALSRERRVGTVGPPLPRTEVRIVDAEGREPAPGEVGEIIIRGPTVMKGYHRRPQATAEAIRAGWFRSGDLGSVDADGYLRIVDRIKDMIISGGYNVYPREVEEVLYEHPDVVEAAVVGVGDDHFGETVAAVLALRAGASASPEQLRDWTKQRLSAYKAPRHFRFVDELPKGPTGKILKRAIDRGAIQLERSGE